jgi:glutathione S-transferase
MLKVYGWKSSSNVQKVLWCLGELGLEHDLVGKGGPFGGHKEPEYLKLNPNGLLPTIDDDGVVLWESNAIVRYLAAKHGQGGLWPTDLAERAGADRWMDWQQTVIRDAITPVFLGMVRKKPHERDMAAIGAARDRLAAALRILDAHLAAQPYVAGPRFTMGDIPLGIHVWRWYAMDIKREDFPNLKAWYERLCRRRPFDETVVKVGFG